MKILTILLLFTLASCSPQFLPLTGSQKPPQEIISDKPFEQVWSKIIDVFAANGYSIKVIDKSSGIIVTEKYRFNTHYAYESTGNYSEDKWVVVQAVQDWDGQLATPDEITGEWNVRIKNLDTGKTSIMVNLVNLNAFTTVYRGTKSQRTATISCYSTGNFEKGIAEKIK